MPPPRRRSRRPLVLLLALVAVVIGIAYYEVDYKPRHYMQDWAQQAGRPQGNFSGGVVTGDNHAITLQFSEQCFPSTPCSPAPVEAVGDWLEAAGGYVDDDLIARCFRDGNSFNYSHDRHLVYIDCDQVDTVQFTFRFTARLDY
jgi:hypothetical protein